MAGIDFGGHGAKRSVNQEIPLIPFIDFLLCLVAFLLVTAVWSQMARISADANVPGRQEGVPIDPKVEKELHVEMRGERKFALIWKEGSTVVNTMEVERKRVNVGSEGDYGYPALGAMIAREWSTNGAHRAPSDRVFDRAVLHTDNTSPFSDIIAVIDAVHTPQRDLKVGNVSDKYPAFNLTFAVN